MDPEGLRTDTLLQHLAEKPKGMRAVAPPIYQTSLFVYERAEELMGLLQAPPEDGTDFQYSRVGNPNTRMLEKKIAMLEGTDDCRVFGSGMAAISAAILSSVNTGGHIVSVDTVYGPSRGFMSQYLERFNIGVTYVDGLYPESVLDAIKPETQLVYLESPSSIVFRLQDLEAITKETRARKITTLFDNTYSTPLYQQPAAMGIDLIAHSASKYLSGHSDVVAGALCGDSDRMERIFQNEVPYLGAILPPFPAWLMLRGLRTIKLRVKAHEESANTVAAYLESHSLIAKVNHVSLRSFPQRDLYLKQMKGSGGLFSFEPKFQGREEVLSFVNSLKVFQIGVSWGGFESLVVPQLVQPMGYSEPTWVVRLFCGLEDVRDLISDLDQALQRVGNQP